MTEIGSFDLEDMEREVAEVAAAPVVDPWLARRAMHFCASEIAPLLVALGRATPGEVAALPKYMREQASSLFRRKAWPSSRERKAGSAAKRGQQAERACLAAWGASDCPIRRQLASITHSDAAPRSWYPLVDRHCPESAATPDGWGVDIFGDDVGLEVKTTMEPIGQTPWWFTMQVQQQNAAGAYPWSAIVIGEGWAHWQTERRQAPRAVRVERDEEQIERIRAACRDGWARVMEMRAERKQVA